MKTVLQNFNVERFLRQYWQQKPLVVRGALSPFPVTLAPEELAGLACEQGVFSRIILEKGGTKPWEVRRGPFTARQFRSLPRSHWTLLVNAVDSLLPQVNALFDYFNFLPSWRLDDIMISYATKGGNVGAHIDNYDVFLIQAAGKREWRISEEVILRDDFREGLDVKLLKKFKATKRMVMQPGDMLYLPPRIPHHGIALDSDCMTFSIGFRAPGYSEMLDSLVTNALAMTEESERYTDPKIKRQHPGELARDARARIKARLTEILFDEEEFDRWLGTYLTEPCEERQAEKRNLPPASKLRALARSGATLVREEGVRILYSVHQNRIVLYVGGQRYELPKSSLRFVQVMSGTIRTPVAELLKVLKLAPERQLLGLLFNEGTFRLE